MVCQNANVQFTMLLRLPRRSTSRSCSIRRDFRCRLRSISLISSNRMVPPWACSNFTRTSLNGADKCAFVVAKQCRLQHIIWNRGTVNRNKTDRLYGSKRYEYGRRNLFTRTLGPSTITLASVLATLSTNIISLMLFSSATMASPLSSGHGSVTTHHIKQHFRRKWRSCHVINSAFFRAATASQC